MTSIALSRSKLYLTVELAPLVAGVTDCWAVLGYALNSSPQPLQAAAIVVKLLLVLAGQKSAIRARHGASFCLLFLGLLLFSDLLSAAHDAAVILQVVAFFVSLYLTVILCAGVDRTADYLKTVSTFIALSAVIYLSLLAIGAIPTTSAGDRYFYFGGSHPNLGAETNAIAIVMACLAYSGFALVWRCVLLFPPIVLMQGRSAMITAALAISLSILFAVVDRYKKSPRAVLASLVVTVPALVFLTANAVVRIVSSGLMLDDTYRGLGTGVVGRSHRWDQGWDLFVSHPLIGNGPAYYATNTVESAHDYFLYGLVLLGISFFIVIAMMTSHYMKIARQTPRAAAIFGSLLILMIFNDRFVNLNIYPFGLYVLLLTLTASGASAVKTPLLQ